MAENSVPLELTDSARESIARTLQFGGGISFALLVAGLLLNAAPATRVVGGFALHAGIVALLATPAARIVVAGWQFYRAGQRRFVGLCALALIVVAVSVIVGLMRFGGRA